MPPSFEERLPMQLGSSVSCESSSLSKNTLNLIEALPISINSWLLNNYLANKHILEGKRVYQNHVILFPYSVSYKYGFLILSESAVLSIQTPFSQLHLHKNFIHTCNTWF